MMRQIMTFVLLKKTCGNFTIADSAHGISIHVSSYTNVILCVLYHSGFVSILTSIFRSKDKALHHSVKEKKIKIKRIIIFCCALNPNYKYLLMARFYRLRDSVGCFTEMP